MADSIRQKIVSAVVTRMALINGSGGYVTAIGTTIDESGNAKPSVEDSRTQWQQEELPAISVFDGDNQAAGKSSVAGMPSGPQAIIHRMPILVRGFLPSNELDAKAARNLIKDILTAIRVDDVWTVSGTRLVMQSDEIRDAVNRNADSFEIESCEVEFEVQFISQKFNAEA